MADGKKDTLLGSKTLKATTELFTSLGGGASSAAKGGAGIVGGVAKGVGNTAKRADSIAAGVLRAPVAKQFFMVAAVVVAYKSIKSYFTNKKKTNEAAALEQQAAQLEAENSALVKEYSGRGVSSHSAHEGFDNPNAKGGHVANYQQSQHQGVSQGAYRQ